METPCSLVVVITGLDQVIHRRGRHGRLCLYDGKQAKGHAVYWRDRFSRPARLPAPRGHRIALYGEVRYEHHDRIEDAIQREKNIKHWPRQWKIELIEAFNPDWNDLYETLNN
jgi:hypothetical protein